MFMYKTPEVRLVECYQPYSEKRNLTDEKLIRRLSVMKSEYWVHVSMNSCHFRYCKFLIKRNKINIRVKSREI